MRDYGKVFSRIWESADFRALTEDGRTLVMYLLTCQHGTIAGIFRLPDGYACEDLQWSAERVSEGFANVAEKGFATRDEATKWVWVTKFLEWNPPENPNQKKAAAKIASQVPVACSWRAQFLYETGPLMGMPEQPAPLPPQNPSETVPEALLNQYQKQEQKQELEQKQEGPPRKRSAAQPSALITADVLEAEGVNRQHANDWLKVRAKHKAPLTVTAWDGLKSEALKAGISAAKAVEICAVKSWRGFDSTWDWPGKTSTAPPSKQTALEARNAAAAQRILEAANGSA